jgi:hypothetical protein
VAPAGNYLVSATGEVYDQNTDAATLCQLQAYDVATSTTTTLQTMDINTENSVDGITIGLDGGGSTLSLSAVATIGSDSRFQVTCTSDDDPNGTIQTLNLSALAVGAVN